MIKLSCLTLTFGITVCTSRLNSCAPLNITAEEAKNETNLIILYKLRLPISGLLFPPLSAWGDKQRCKPLTLNLLPYLAGALHRRSTLALRLHPVRYSTVVLPLLYTVLSVWLYQDEDMVQIYWLMGNRPIKLSVRPYEILTQNSKFSLNCESLTVTLTLIVLNLKHKCIIFAVQPFKVAVLDLHVK